MIIKIYVLLQVCELFLKKHMHLINELTKFSVLINISIYIFLMAGNSESFMTFYW